MFAYMFKCYEMREIRIREHATRALRLLCDAFYVSRFTRDKLVMRSERKSQSLRTDIFRFKMRFNKSKDERKPTPHL